MAESLRILKRRASQKTLNIGASQDDRVPNDRTELVTITPLAEAEGTNQYEVIRKKISKPVIDIYPEWSSSQPKHRTPRQPINAKLGVNGSRATSQKVAQLIDKHLKEGRQSTSPRLGQLSDSSLVNRDLLHKYLGPSKDKDFLKIPDNILNPVKSNNRHGNARFKVRELSDRQKETTKLTEDEERLFSGALDNLPPESSNIVRVFISSTFLDFKEERNMILKTAYPLLKNFCNWLGLEFHLVDMRWGITDEATNDHLTERLCLKEIDNCNRVSFGPSFVCFVGDRYGYRPVPYEIDADEFESLCRVADDLRLDNAELFRKWYLKDDNAQPPTYVIQPINTYFPYFDDTREQVQANRMEGRKRWNLELQRLQRLFQQTAIAAHSQRLLSEKTLKNLKMSVTEMEITRAMESRSEDILCFHRDLVGLNADLQNPVSSQFTDLLASEIGAKEADEDAKVLRDHLWNTKIRSVLKPENVTQFKVRWFEGGINGTSHAEHSRYLQSFCTAFLKRIQSLIQLKHDAWVKHNAKTSKKVRDLKEEVLHHANFCKTKCEIFHGREVEMMMVKAFVESKTRAPVIVSAESGSGKTALMANIAKTAPEWLGRHCVRVVRFLGTSPDSSSLHDTLCSICRQICLAYDIPISEQSLLETPTLVRYFHDLLSKVSREHALHRPLLVVLDSIDQLSPVGGAHRLQWMPEAPPNDVYIAISFIPGMFGLYNCARERFREESSYIKVLPLTINSCLAIVGMYMETKQRTLTAEQIYLLRSCFSQKAPLPLLLKMLVDDACRWQSHTNPAEIELQLDVEDAIRRLFLRIERTYGTKLVAYALGYLTISQNGLTELELKDTLSCNDEVVNEIFVYHDPPVPGIVRVPHLFWTRIKHEIGDYIVERQTDGKTTFYWYHRQFIKAARERYVSEELLPGLHADLAQIFLAENGVYKTIKLNKRNLLVKNANRQVTPQPLTKHNRRKLRALSYHLLYAGQIDSLITNCLCNLYYLVARIQAFSVAEVLHEFSRVLSVVKNPVIQTVAECIRQAHALIQGDILQLGIQLLGRLQTLAKEHASIAQLCHQTRLWFREKQKPVLVPAYECFPVNSGSSAIWQIGGPTSLIGFHEKKRYVLGFCPSDHSHGTHLQVIDLKDRRLAFTISQIDGHFKAAEILELNRYKLKVLILTEKVLRVTVFSVGGYALETRYLPADFADTDHHLALNTVCFYEHFRFGRYSLKFVLASNNKIFDVPERQYFNEEAEQKQPDLIDTSNYVEIRSKQVISGIRVLSSGHIVTCHGPGENSLKGDKSRGALIVWEDGRRSFHIVLPSPVYSSKMIISSQHDPHTVLVGCQNSEIVIISRKLSKWKALLLKSDLVEGKMSSLMYNGLCKLAISVSNKREAALYNVEREVGLFTSRLENTKAVGCACVTDSGGHVITGHASGEVLLWKINMQKGSLTATRSIQSQTEPITEIHLQGESMIYVLSEDRTLKCFSQPDLIKPEPKLKKPANANALADYALADENDVNGFLIYRKDMHVVTSSEDRPPKVWLVSSGQYVRSMSARISDEGTSKIVFGHREKYVVGRTTNGDLRLWQYESGETVRTPVIHDVVDFCLTSNSMTVLALQYRDKCLKLLLYSLERHSVVKASLVGQGRGLYLDKMLLTEDDNFLVLTVRTKGMENVTSRALQAIDIKRPENSLIPCTKGQKAAQRGRKAGFDIPTYCAEVLYGSVVLVGKNGEAFIWDISQQTVRPDSKHQEGKANSLCHSYVIHSYLNDSGTHTSPVVSVAKSKDGKLLATADTEGFVVIWNLETPKEMARDVGNFQILHKHADSVTAMAFSHSGGLLVTGSADQTLRVWDTCSGALKHQATIGMEAVSVTISAENGYLIALTRDKTQSMVMIFKMLCMDC